MAVAVVAVLLDSLLLGALLSNVPLFLTVVAEVVTASALKEGMLDWASMLGSQWHLIFGGCGHQGVGNMSVTYLL